MRVKVSTLFSACVVVTFAVSSIHCAVEISQSTVDSGIFGWEQSYAILFDDFLCDVVNPLLPPDERFEECGGTFALNPDGIGILPEQVDQATRTITTERFEERTKYGSSSEETTSIEGEMPSTEAQKLQKKLQAGRVPARVGPAPTYGCADRSPTGIRCQTGPPAHRY